MTDLVLDDAQLQVVRAGGSRIPVFDASGQEVGVLFPVPVGDGETADLTSEELHKLADRMAMTDVEWSSTEQVLNRLKARTAT